MFIVFDLDDTLADTSHRQYILEEGDTKDSETWNAFFDACDKDAPVFPIISVFNALYANHAIKIEIWTGRSESVRKKTVHWLERNTDIGVTLGNVRFQHSDQYELRMRPEGDYRHDTEIKAEWIETHGKPDLVFDDRNTMVQWWRDQDVVCCQVKESDF